MRIGLRYVLGATLAVALSARVHAQPAACASRLGSDGARIEEAGFVPLGGIEQFVTIRGDHRSNPVLLHVHGGPGIAFSAFTAEFAPYEADFTVVQWDQRGAGCTFGRHGESTTDLTLDTLANDGVELAAYLRDRLGSQNIVVLAHSGGSIVAVEMIRRAPERFSAYVGTGQFVSFAAIADADITYLRRFAAGDAGLTTQLDSLEALDSSPLEKFLGVNRLLAAHQPPIDAAFMEGLQSRAARVMAMEELATWQAARRASAGRLLPQIAAVDLSATALRLEVPFVLIQGSDDLNTPTEVAKAYFEQVDAPSKKFVVIDGAGHFAHLTHAPQFLSALREHSNSAFRTR